MSLLLKITAFFAVAIAMLFTQSHAAPITADLGILPHPYYQGQVQQQDPVPDPGFGVWFTEISDGFLELMAKGLKDRDPKKIKAVKDYIKQMRILTSPVTDFILKYYPEDTAANNIMNVINTYLSSLDKLTEDPSVSKDIKSLAKLMKMFNAVSS